MNPKDFMMHKTPPKRNRCKHTTIHIYASKDSDNLAFAWCWKCGAMRLLGTDAMHKWILPVGLNGANPALKDQ